MQGGRGIDKMRDDETRRDNKTQRRDKMRQDEIRRASKHTDKEMEGNTLVHHTI